VEPVKVVVAGPQGAGKSMLVRTIADMMVRSTDPQGNSFDLGRITIGRDIVLYLYGANSEPDPGSGGWETITSGMLGSILVVDCARPDGTSKAFPHVQWFGAQQAPMLLAANRCPPDAVGAVARDLEVDAAIVHPLDCSDRAQVRDVVVALLEAALTAAQPTAVSMEMQARLG
jgi:signal recognition particle receptor subunit beta